MKVFFDYLDNFLATATPVDNAFMVLGGLLVLCGLVGWAGGVIRGKRQ